MAATSTSTKTLPTGITRLATVLWSHVKARIEVGELPPSSPPATKTVPAAMASDPRQRFFQLIETKPVWARRELLIALKAGRYRGELLIHEALARGWLVKKGRTQGARLTRTATPLP